MTEKGLGTADILNTEVEGAAGKFPPLEIVSFCPHCGAPIYGKKNINYLEHPPPAKYSCLCHHKLKM